MTLPLSLRTGSTQAHPTRYPRRTTPTMAPCTRGLDVQLPMEAETMMWKTETTTTKMVTPTATTPPHVMDRTTMSLPPHQQRKERLRCAHVASLPCHCALALFARVCAHVRARFVASRSARELSCRVIARAFRP